VNTQKNKQSESVEQDTPERFSFSPEITPQVSRITKNNPNGVDFASHKG